VSSPLDDRSTWLLSRAQLRAGTILRQTFAREGARGYQYRLLLALAEAGSCSQAELSRAAGVDPKDVVGALNDLGARSLVCRENDPRDRRRKLVRITDGGQAELTRLDRVLDQVQEEVLAPLDARERRTLMDLLHKLT
jgi:DNA-binding MarR family transcriptional regulator